ncbi:DNA-processing protein DprA [Pseudanabaena sp. PCC 6802]|uniref:DNA-processing protein DprA n=1 Tax=Pseudanabaena sp. PCC 6802 TaxID=118173 RepID=UPI000349CA18|nr:DNA-processing protein DprA [Pseudanabaena sp. PCC 6802]
MEKAYWLAWSKVPQIGPVSLKRIYQHFGNLKDAWSASSSELLEVEGIGKQIASVITATRREIDPPALLEEYQRQNPRFWTPSDDEYPKLLWEIPDPPPILHYAGSLTKWAERSTVGMVGTRSPSGYGRRWAQKIGKALAEHGFTVVSGLADGVDAEAHRGCLSGEGNAIAVVGTGVNIVYPPKNQSLYQEIIKSGLVVSEYPHNTQPDRVHFPARNRIIAGLCRATIVIEAPEKSGALITAHQANEYGRDVFALPGSLDTHHSLGCLKLIGNGAQVILGVDELIAALGAMPGLDPDPQTEPVQLPLLEPTQQRILAAIAFGEPIGFDRIVETVGLPAGEVSGALLQLELIGAIAPSPGMRYQRLI